MRRSIFIFGLIFIALTLVVTPAARTAPSFTQLDVTLKGVSISGTVASAINKSGAIVGYYTTGGVDHGFLYSGSGYTDVFYPGSGLTEALGINDNGVVVGFYMDGPSVTQPNFHGFTWSATGGYKSVDVSGATSGTFVQAINNNGVLAGYFSDSAGSHGFTMNGSTVTKLDAPLTTGTPYFTQAWGINTGGSVSGNYADANGMMHGFLYSGGKYTSFDAPTTVGTPAPGGTYTVGRGLNTNCVVVGAYADTTGNANGLVRQGTSYSVDDDPSGAASETDGINDSGQVVGLFTDALGNGHGFLSSVSVGTTSFCTATTDPKKKHHHDRDHDKDHHDNDRDRHDNDRHHDGDDGDGN